MAQLSTQVAMGPLSFDVPADYLQLHYELEQDKLDGTLVKLSQTVARNAKVTNGMRDELGALKAHIDNSVAKLQRTINVMDDNARAVKEQLVRVYDEVKGLQGTSVRRADFEVEKDLIWKSLTAAKDFIKNYEETNGHMAQVEAHMRTFLPAWYEPIAKNEKKALDDALKKVQETTLERVRTSITDAATAHAEASKNLELMVDTRISGVEAHAKNLNEKYGTFDERFAKLSTGIASIANTAEGTKDKVATIEVEVAMRDAKVNARHDALLDVFGMSTKEVALMASSANGNATPIPLGASMSGSARGDAPQPPSDAEQGVLTRDQVTERLLQLPVFQSLIATAKKSSSDAAEEASQRVVQAVHNITRALQNDLADKVGLSKLKELIEKNRDDKLYRNVDTLLRDVGSVRDLKKEVERVVTAVSSKADRSDLEAKVDKQFVTTAVDHATHKVAEATATLDEFKSKMKQLEQRVQQQGAQPMPAGGLQSPGATMYAGGGSMGEQPSSATGSSSSRAGGTVSSSQKRLQQQQHHQHSGSTLTSPRGATKAGSFGASPGSQPLSGTVSDGGMDNAWMPQAQQSSAAAHGAYGIHGSSQQPAALHFPLASAQQLQAQIDRSAPGGAAPHQLSPQQQHQHQHQQQLQRSTSGHGGVETQLSDGGPLTDSHASAPVALVDGTPVASPAVSSSDALSGAYPQRSPRGRQQQQGAARGPGAAGTMQFTEGGVVNYRPPGTAPAAPPRSVDPPLGDVLYRTPVDKFQYDRKGDTRLLGQRPPTQ